MRWAVSGSLVASLVVVACARSSGTSSASPEPAASAVESSEAAVTAPAVPVGDGRCPHCTDGARDRPDVERMVHALEQISDRMCACHDARCMTSVSDDLTRVFNDWETRRAGLPEPVVSADLARRQEIAAERHMECVNRVAAESHARTNQSAPP